MKASIVVCTYNHAQFLERCLRSLLHQKTAFDYEIIVVNDCSPDLTSEILEKFVRDVRIITNKKNLGLAESANVGIKSALGEYVVRVDSDDYVSEHFVEVLTLGLEMIPEVAATSCDYVTFDTGNPGTLVYHDSSKYPIACGIMYRKDALFEVGLYDPIFRFNEDADLRIRFSKKFLTHRIALPLYRYRRHDSNLTNDQSLVKHYDQVLSQKHEPSLPA